jgi:hypothetical protein
MLISTSILRLTWAVVEETSPRDLLTLSDTLLVKRLLQHVTQKNLLSGEEVCALYGYLGSKVSLIRDLAESRSTRDIYALERAV